MFKGGQFLMSGVVVEVEVEDSIFLIFSCKVNFIKKIVFINNYNNCK